jgi:hypothetical protein
VRMGLGRMGRMKMMNRLVASVFADWRGQGSLGREVGRGSRHNGAA